MTASAIVPIAVIVFAVAASAITDIWKLKVYNALTLPLMLVGMLYHAFTGGSLEVASSVLGMAFGFAALAPFYLLGGMGGGDVKLMAAVGAWLGMRLTFYVLMASCLTAGIYALIIMFMYGRLGETWLNLQVIWHRIKALGRHLVADDHVETNVNRADRRMRVIPFAAMIAIGVLVTLLWFFPGEKP